MRDAWTIAAKDLRRRLRDRTAVLVGLVLPFGLAWIFSLTLGDVASDGFDATYAVVSRDAEGHLPTRFRALLEGLDFVTLREASSVTEAETLADDGTIDAAIVFPDGFTHDVLDGRGGSIVVLTAPDAQIAGLVAGSLAESFASDLNAVTLSVATIAGSGAPGRRCGRRSGTIGPTGCGGPHRERRGSGSLAGDVLRDRDGRVLPVLLRGVRRAGAARGA
jgi:ABC-2 type transport system permease protein